MKNRRTSELHAHKYCSALAAEKLTEDSHAYRLSEGVLATTGKNTAEVVMKVPGSCTDAAAALDGGDTTARPAGGASAGAWFTFTGQAAEMPTNQAAEDARALCFDTAKLEEDMLVCGTPSLTVQVQATTPGSPPSGNLVARLCAVAPGGKSSVRLSYYGVVNVSKVASESTAGNHAVSVTVDLNYTTVVIPAGYSLRLALSADYWPIVVPQWGGSGLSVRCRDARLLVPRAPAGSPAIAAAEAAAKRVVPTEVHIPRPAKVSVLKQGSQDVRETIGANSSSWCMSTATDHGSRKYQTHQAVVVKGTTSQEYSLGKLPESIVGPSIEAAIGAGHTVTYESTFKWPERKLSSGEVFPAVSAETRVSSTMASGSANALCITTNLEALQDGEMIFSRQWMDTISRTSI
ncbi:hypothetical protein CYMTET_44570 [Cymbomonas tetramitiformis]|uniref:Xaa-Pro dipeptidyl-peptidase C-terminal domain-containing protein n=1 Tax=Cymbomonas tetramitiformis TaxID=36881 RepID=A0AAE0BZY7_9CHLO|nr:hypothetical protein CYMTET_44570 [Cymbomonas tetramitiformis]